VLRCYDASGFFLVAGLRAEVFFLAAVAVFFAAAGFVVAAGFFSEEGFGFTLRRADLRS
jgi:hypothetical protein